MIEVLNIIIGLIFVEMEQVSQIIIILLIFIVIPLYYTLDFRFLLYLLLNHLA